MADPASTTSAIGGVFFDQQPRATRHFDRDDWISTSWCGMVNFDKSRNNQPVFDRAKGFSTDAP